MANTRGLLALALLWTACGSNRGTRAIVDPDLSRYMLPGAVLLAGVEMEQIRSTPAYRKLEAQRKLKPLDDFAARTGFDPRADVRSFLIHSDGAQTVIAAHGNFRLPVADSVSRFRHGEHTIYIRQNGALAMIDTHTAIAGTVEGVRRALEQSRKSAAATDLIARAEKIPQESQIWAVTIGGGEVWSRAIPSHGNAANLNRILRSFEESSFWADLRSGIRVTAVGVAATEKDAELLAKTIGGFLAIVRVQTLDRRPELLELIDSVSAVRHERTVRIAITVPQYLADRLLR